MGGGVDYDHTMLIKTSRFICNDHTMLMMREGLIFYEHKMLITIDRRIDNEHKMLILRDEHGGGHQGGGPVSQPLTPLQSKLRRIVRYKYVAY